MLQATDIAKSFGGIKALEGASVSVKEGSITALIGPNGAGKTTLFNAIAGFVPIDRGSIVLDGDDITHLNPWQIVRRGLSRTFQTPSGFSSMTVWENLMVAGSDSVTDSPISALFSRGRLASAQRATSRAATEMLDRLSLGNIRDQSLGTLSAADLRFVEIARQLMSQPTLLMLDEPAAGFGPDKIEFLNRFIRRLKSDGITILLIEHNLSFVLGLADHVYVLANGSVIAEGNPDTVAKDEAVISNYIGTGHGAA